MMKTNSESGSERGNAETMPKDAVESLKAMTDYDLYYALQQALEERKVGWSEAANEYGWPKIEAKLAVIRQILCA